MRSRLRGSRLAWTLALALVQPVWSTAGCQVVVELGESRGAASSSGGGTTASLESATSSGAGHDETGAPEPTSSGEAGSTAQADTSTPASCFVPPGEPCPFSCAAAPGYTHDLVTCGEVPIGTLCYASGNPLPEVAGQSQAYYRELEGTGEVQMLVFLQWYSCAGETEQLLLAPQLGTDGWQECVGAEGEPPECACVCLGDACPADADAMALAACSDPLCGGDVLLDSQVLDYTAENICLVEALRDRTPGHVRVNFFSGLGGAEGFLLVQADGTVLVSWAYSGDFGCHGVELSEPFLRCDLAAPDYFDGCLTSYDYDACNQGAFGNFFTNCEPIAQPPACP